MSTSIDMPFAPKYNGTHCFDCVALLYLCGPYIVRTLNLSSQWQATRSKMMLQPASLYSLHSKTYTIPTRVPCTLQHYDSNFSITAIRRQ